MKPRLIVLPTLALTVLALGGCGPKPAPPPPPGAAGTQSARTFAATATHLDTGGDFFLYLRTEEVLGRIPAEMDSWKEALLQTAGSDLPMPREKLEAWYDVCKRAIIDTGLVNLRAFGVSGIELEPGLNRMKSVAYCGEVPDRGLLWNLGGRNAPHPFAALDFLPASTAYATFMDFDPQVLWTFVEKVMNEIPDPSVQQQAQTLPALAQLMIGMTPKELFASLDSEIGIVATAEESATMEVPMDSGTITLPRAAAAILVRVKDDKLYNLIVAKLEETVGRAMPVMKSNKDGIHLAVIQIPDLGIPVPLTPTIARFGNYVAISTTEELALQLARQGANLPPLMKDTPAFQRFAKLEKLDGNAFAYLTERGSGILRTLQLSSIESSGPLPPALKPKFDQLYDLFSQKFMFSIGRVEKDGYATTMYSPGGSKQLIAAVMVVPAAILGAVMVPAITEAQKTAAATVCLSELRQIDLAIEIFSADNNVPPGTIIRPGDLEPYIPADTSLGKRLRAVPFVDSQGNAYSDFVAGTPPQVPAATAADFPKQTGRGFWDRYAAPQ